MMPQTPSSHPSKALRKLQQQLRESERTRAELTQAESAARQRLQVLESTLRHCQEQLKKTGPAAAPARGERRAGAPREGALREQGWMLVCETGSDMIFHLGPEGKIT